MLVLRFKCAIVVARARALEPLVAEIEYVRTHSSPEMFALFTYLRLMWKLTCYHASTMGSYFGDWVISTPLRLTWNRKVMISFLSSLAEKGQVVDWISNFWVSPHEVRYGATFVTTNQRRNESIRYSYKVWSICFALHRIVICQIMPWYLNRRSVRRLFMVATYFGARSGKPYGAKECRVIQRLNCQTAGACSIMQHGNLVDIVLRNQDFSPALKLIYTIY